MNFQFLPYLLFTILFAGQNLIQRCVIVQRDDKGYGLTVTGDNPVYVQSVKDGMLKSVAAQKFKYVQPQNPIT